MLKRGLIKRVGPGDINVWEENWIPGVTSFKPLVRLPRVTVERVHDLFILGTRVWDEALVQRSFISIEASEVLKIKTSMRLDEDVLAWAPEKHGFYTVRSAYKLLKQDGSCYGCLGRDIYIRGASVWKLLWKLDVPPKIRVFWWRVLHNSLPSKPELTRRHISKESYCEMCGEPDESLFHVFFDCPVAKRFWYEVKKVSGVVIPRLHPCSWATDML